MNKFNLETEYMSENMDGIPPGTTFYPISAFTAGQLKQIFDGKEDGNNAAYIMIVPDKKDSELGKLLREFTAINTPI
jgi:hypothetical protein